MPFVCEEGRHMGWCPVNMP